MHQDTVVFNTWMEWKGTIVEAGRSAENEAAGINIEEIETKEVRLIYSQPIFPIFPSNYYLQKNY